MLTAAFECSDEGGSGIASCTATLNETAIENGAAIGTAAVGPQVLTVTATDGAGDETVKTITVTVVKKAVVEKPVVEKPTECPRLITGQFANGTNANGSMLRLYVAVFGRQPDAGGHAYWVQQHGNGATLWEIAREFVASEEFVATYAELDNKSFVELLYTNVMGRTGDAEGQAY